MRRDRAATCVVAAVMLATSAARADAGSPTAAAAGDAGTPTSAVATAGDPDATAGDAGSAAGGAAAMPPGHPPTTAAGDPHAGGSRAGMFDPKEDGVVPDPTLPPGTI
jgi:hypothetical protein